MIGKPLKLFLEGGDLGYTDKNRGFRMEIKLSFDAEAVTLKSKFFGCLQELAPQGL